VHLSRWPNIPKLHVPDLHDNVPLDVCIWGGMEILAVPAEDLGPRVEGPYGDRVANA
jgi:hypothetical protein